MATTTFTKQYDKAFLVTDQFFKRLDEFFGSNGIAGNYKVWLSDDSTIDGLTATDLAALPNSRLRRIGRIQFSTAYRADTSVELTLRADQTPPIGYTVKGSDKEANYISAALDKLLRETYLPHSYFSAMPDKHKLAWWIVLTSTSWPFVGAGAYYGIINLSLVGMALTLIPLMYAPLMRRLFPFGNFAIGDGVYRAEHLRRRRATFVSIVFATVILGILVNLSSSYIYDTWAKR